MTAQQAMATARRILRTPEAATYVGLGAPTLEKLRCRGGGPRFLRIGARAVGYDVRDLEVWIASRQGGESTSDNPIPPPPGARTRRKATARRAR